MNGINDIKMQEIGNSFILALELIRQGNADLYEIIGLSLRVSLTAVALSCLIGMPLGAALALAHFRGRSLIVLLVNTLMGLPPVVVGVVVYLILSRSGPLGLLGLLYTATAMIIAQTLLVVPIVIALTRQQVETLHNEYQDLFRSLDIRRLRAIQALLVDARFGLPTVALAGFGRAIAEVGAVMIVGGNINHVTRVMTTAIALETSRGQLALAVALGLVLLCLAIIVNGAVMALNAAAARRSYA